MIIDDFNTVLRLVISLVLGGVIGFERQLQRKTAGLRTHILVCLGSCLVAIMSVNLYANVQGLTNADPARLAAQVVSGIGFLGAGAIMKEGPTIKGLTTAASLWVVASVGLAVGVGAMTGAVTTTLLVVIALEVLPRIDRLYQVLSPSVCTLMIHSLDKPGQIGQIGSVLGTLGIGITQIHIEDGDSGQIFVPLTITIPDKCRLEQVIAELGKIDGVLSIKIPED
ncbi:MgtC/SapB family protein [Acetonema longum]|uniref:MgtC/SapB transporter n=1 Tax=Acetonema longum DSM 6540 TaxID=1009370 RepID=F7NQF4_9FIRM|nr:MgtC/SapB family protein [Acetonema longum]EGO61732.1 MgtC/SapB transporter [Acetonema longum DSM 6540]